jgi:putative DNA primase/helicase
MKSTNPPSGTSDDNVVDLSEHVASRPDPELESDTVPGGKTPDHIRGTSDDTLAVDFANEAHGQLRYAGQWNKWMAFDGTKWEIDHVLKSYSLGREFVRRVAKRISDRLYKFKCDEMLAGISLNVRKERQANARAESRKAVKGILSNRTIHAVVSLARCDNRIAASVEQWDSDPWMLNTPSGTIDLKTGATRKHDPLDYITMITAVSPTNERPKLWLEFLKTIMHGDEEMLRYLQKVFGYCLVGETKEHEMYFAYGTGKNGKGVTLNTIRGLIGSYGKEAAIETFITSQSERHPTELADLRGTRLVTCGETDDGQRWAEARIKMLTGGDPVKARFMRQDFFQYQPQFKLFLAGNHKPRLSNVDEAIKRRFRLIPFTYTVPDEERDVDLPVKLKAEWPAILQWCIEGCLAWQSDGIKPPTSVSAATKSYLSQEDAITNWYTECCEAEDKSFVYIKDLFDSWRAWAMENGDVVGTKRILSRHLEDREPILKISKARRGEGFGFMGLRMLDKSPKKSD